MRTPLPAALVAVAVASIWLIGSGSSAVAATESGSNADSAWAGLIGAIAVVISAGISFGGVLYAQSEARRLARETLETERAKRQSDLSLQVTTLLSGNKDVARQASRRFAVGVVKVFGILDERTQKVDERTDFEGKGQICFIPVNSRVTLGRNDDNDIVFPSNTVDISRYHCGFVSESREVYVEDYRSLNGTMLNNDKVETG